MFSESRFLISVRRSCAPPSPGREFAPRRPQLRCRGPPQDPPHLRHRAPERRPGSQLEERRPAGATPARGDGFQRARIVLSRPDGSERRRQCGRRRRRRRAGELRGRAEEVIPLSEALCASSGVMAKRRQSHGVGEALLPTAPGPHSIASLNDMIGSFVDLDLNGLRLQWRNHLGGTGHRHAPECLRG